MIEKNPKWGYQGKIDNETYTYVCLGYAKALEMWNKIQIPSANALKLVSYSSGEYQMEASHFHSLVGLVATLHEIGALEDKKNILQTSLKYPNYSKARRRQIIGFFLDCNNNPSFKPNYNPLSISQNCALIATNLLFELKIKN